MTYDEFFKTISGLQSKLRQLAVAFYRSQPGKPLIFEVSERFDNHFNVYDGNYPQVKKKIGSVTLGGSTFSLSSRLITNKKYNESSSNYNTRETTNFDRALSIMIDTFKPWSPMEFLDGRRYAVADVLTKWRDKFKHKAYATFSPDHQVIYEEVKALHAMGVQFKTPEFRAMVDALEMGNDNVERRNANMILFYMVVDAKGHIDYAWSNDIHQGNTPFDALDKGRKTHVTSDEFLPEYLKSEYAMLKMMNPSEEIDGVGKRLSDFEYVIYKRVDDVRSI
jgi:hypothetical protein